MLLNLRICILSLPGLLAGAASASPVVPLPATPLSSQGSIGGCAFVGARLYCWGDNDNGLLGNGSTGPSSLAEWVRRPDTPTGDFVAPVAVSVTDRRCVADAAGVWCWGRNEQGQLGSGDRLVRNIPARIPGLPAGIVAIAQGRYHGCARSAADGLWCWGGNSFGETGQPPAAAVFDPLLGMSVTPPLLVAQRVPVLPDKVDSVVLGDHHGCVLAAGRVWCWGANDAGQLGDGSGAHRSTPVAVGSLPAGVVAIASSPHHSCALDGAGGVWCWGNNYAGQVGVAPATGQLVERLPVRVAGLPGPASAIALGFAQSCARVAGLRWCWGSPGSGGATPRLQPAAGAPGDWLAGCFAAADATLHCSQPGERHPRTQIDAREVPGLAGEVREFALGRQFGCARLADGSVWCWGANESGQLGQGDVLPRTSAVRVPLAPASALAAGLAHVCARTEQGLMCWGDNRYGALGDGSTVSRPAPVLARFDGSLIAAGAQHTCAWSGSAGLRCWGRNERGQVDGTPGESPVLDPARPLGDAPVIELALGLQHSCATIAAPARETRCWGRLPLNEIDFASGTADHRVRVFPAGAPLRDEPEARLRSNGATACIGDRCYGLNVMPPDRGVQRVALPVQLPAGVDAGFTLGARLVCGLGLGTDLRCAALTNRVCAYEALAGMLATPNQGIACQLSQSLLSPEERGWQRVVGLPARPTRLAAGEQFACGAIGQRAWCWGPVGPALPAAANFGPVYRAGSVEPAPSVALTHDPARTFPAYAVASVSLLDPTDPAAAGSWGLDLLLSGGRRYLNGGLNFGGFGTANGNGVPGYAAFSIQNPLGPAQRVNIDLSGDGGQFVLTVESTVPPSTIRTEVLRDTLTLGATAQRRSLTLPNGFHIVGLQPTSGTRLFLAALGTTQPDGAPAAFQGGAVVGGYLDGERTGFAGVCTDDASAISLRTQARSTRDAAGAGDLRLQVIEGQSGMVLYDSE